MAFLPNFPIIEPLRPSLNASGSTLLPSSGVGLLSLSSRPLPLGLRVEPVLLLSIAELLLRLLPKNPSLGAGVLLLLFRILSSIDSSGIGEALSLSLPERNLPLKPLVLTLPNIGVVDVSYSRAKSASRLD